MFSDKDQGGVETSYASSNLVLLIFCLWINQQSNNTIMHCGFVFFNKGMALLNQGIALFNQGVALLKEGMAQKRTTYCFSLVIVYHTRR